MRYGCHYYLQQLLLIYSYLQIWHKNSKKTIPQTGSSVYLKPTYNSNFSLKKSSGNILSISQIIGLQPLSKISWVRSPPLRQISPLGTKAPSTWILCFLSNGLLQCHRSFNGATARETTVSNFLFLISSARVCCVVRLVKPIAAAISLTTFNFLLML